MKLPIVLLGICICTNQANAYTTSETSDFSCPVKLEIYNGCYDWLDDVSWSGGQLAGQEGAVVVANKNDTDGDDTPDWGDDIVLANDMGRNEVDLMKIVIDCVNPNESPQNLTYILSATTPTGLEIAVYRNPSKDVNTKISLPYTFQASDNFPLELYVEASKESSALMDIKLKVDKGQNFSSEVSATSVWVEFVEKYMLSQSAPDPTTIGVINNSIIWWVISMSIGANGNRYGHGNFRNESDVDQRFGGRVLFKWHLHPEEAISLVTIDETRQRETMHWDVEDSNTGFDCELVLNSELSESFPWKLPNPADNELPNDDLDMGGEDGVTPAGDYFSWDAPAIDRRIEFGNEPKNYPYQVDRTNFYEFVRLAVGENYSFQAMGNGGNIVVGSRVADKIPWSNSIYAVKDNDFNLSADDALKSMSHLRTFDWLNDHNSYPISYQVQALDMTYEYSTYLLSIQDDGNSKSLLLDRITFDPNYGCIDVETYVELLPTGTLTYDVVFDEHAIQVTESTPLIEETFLWHTYFSNNKLNDIDAQHISLEK